MIRLDKFLTIMEIGTRSQVKSLIKKGCISIDGIICKNPDHKFEEENSVVTYLGQPLKYIKYEYYLLNKPKNVVTATQDTMDKTVMDLIDIPRKKEFFPVGRLDKDTEGFLLITNDGKLAHILLSPKKHVDKTYYMTIKKELSEEDVRELENGVDIGEEKPTLPSKVEIISPFEINITIHEGKFHQVKRMLHAVDNEVTYLKRISFGSLILDESLNPGEYRSLTQNEVSLLYHDAGLEY